MPAKKLTDKKVKQAIEETLSDLLSHLKVEVSIEVAREKDSEKQQDNYKVNIQTEETGLIIGYHGETLNSLQLLLGVILYKKLDSWVRVVLDVGDYRKEREEDIKEMVTRIVDEIEVTNQPVALPFLTPLERRIVHLALVDNEKVTSESEGIGRERRVVIRPKQK